MEQYHYNRVVKVESQCWCHLRRRQRRPLLLPQQDFGLQPRPRREQLRQPQLQPAVPIRQLLLLVDLLRRQEHRDRICQTHSVGEI